MADPDWDAAARLLGAERVILARPVAPDWSLTADRLLPHDQLYRRVLGAAELASTDIVDTNLLGDAGRRLVAAGITRLLVVDGPQPGTLLIAENPAVAGTGNESARPSGTGQLPSAETVAAALEAALPPSAFAADGDLLASWLAELAALPAQPLVSPAGATALARAAGVELAVFLWSGPDHVEGCWGGVDCGRRPLPSLSWPLPESPEVLHGELDALTARPPTAPWRVVTARRGPLAVAVSPPHAPPVALELMADLLAFDAERMRTSPGGRQHSLLEERVRIAGLIHDGVTQQVSNVMIQLQLVELAAEDPERLRQTLKDAREATASALEELRASLYELAPRPTALEDLVPSLREWCRDYTAQWGIGVTVEVEGQQRQLDAETNMLAYAVVQEGLTNVRKHAEADSVTVRVAFSPEALTLQVADDGAGFVEAPAEPAGSGRRMGLRLLRDRVRSAGGTLDVVSRPGEGAEVSVRLPI